MADGTGTRNVLTFPKRPRTNRRRRVQPGAGAVHHAIEQRRLDINNIEVVREIEDLLDHAYAGNIHAFVWAGCRLDSGSDRRPRIACDIVGAAVRDVQLGIQLAVTVMREAVDAEFAQKDKR